MIVNAKVLNQRYRKYMKIGEGSSGKVFLGERLSAAFNSNSENQDSNIQAAKQQTSSLIPSKGEGKKYFALKKIKLIGNIAAQDLRELKMLQSFQHKNLMGVEEWFLVDKGYSKSVYVVMDYMIGIKELISNKEIKLSDVQLKQVIYQIVCSVEYLHSHGYLHRDIKPANILITREGVVKLSDFSITTKRRENMTGNTTTRYYRPPEVIYGEKNYGFEIDMWSLGCTLAELLLHEPIFPGVSDINQLQKIFGIVGYPRDKWPEANERYPYYLDFEPQPEVGLKNLLPTGDTDLLDLISSLLTLNPDHRPTIEAVKSHPYLDKVNPNCQELAKLCNYLFEKKLNLLLKK